MSRDRAEAAKLEDVLGAPLEAKRGASDLAPGSYPATLMAFGKPFWMPIADKFQREGGPDKRQVFDAYFAVRTMDGGKPGAALLSYLVPVPTGGATNRKSKLYAVLKACRGGDQNFFDQEGNFKPGVTLKSFLQSPCTVAVEKNAKDFSQIASVTPAMMGVATPSAQECETLIPALQEREAGQGEDGNVPF